MSAPELIESREIYQGKTFAVTSDLVRESGKEHWRDIVHHPGSAAIVAVFEDKTVALVSQYRHASRQTLLEIPAGTRDRKEDVETCARRELEEETGHSAGRIEKLSEFYVSPGYCTEKMWVFLATELKECPAKPDEDEYLNLKRLPFASALQLIQTGEIQDAKSIIALTLAAARVSA